MSVDLGTHQLSILRKLVALCVDDNGKITDYWATTNDFKIDSRTYEPPESIRARTILLKLVSFGYAEKRKFVPKRKNLQYLNEYRVTPSGVDVVKNA